MGQSRIDNPEKLATTGTQDIGRRQKKKKKQNTESKKYEQHRPHQKTRGRTQVLAEVSSNLGLTVIKRWNTILYITINITTDLSFYSKFILAPSHPNSSFLI